MMPKIPDPQIAADKEARKIIRKAYQNGTTVPYSLHRLLSLTGISMKVIRAVYRGK